MWSGISLRCKSFVGLDMLMFRLGTKERPDFIVLSSGVMFVKEKEWCL